MRTSSFSAGLLFLVAISAIADEGEKEARNILDRAIQAHGGADKVAKLCAVRTKLKSTIKINGQDVAVMVERTDQPPTQSKAEMRLELNGQAITTTTVLNGDKTWTCFNGDTEAARTEFGTRKRNELHARWLESLAPLAKDKALGVSPLGEIKVNDRAALGVKVTCKGRLDVDLFFDKETGLLAKSAYQGLNEFDKEVLTECFFSDYKETAGLKRATKFHFRQDDVKTSEHEVVETTLMEKMLEEAEFART